MKVDDYLKNIQLDINDIADRIKDMKKESVQLKCLSFQIGCVREELKSKLHDR